MTTNTIYTEATHFYSDKSGFRQDIMMDGYCYSVNVCTQNIHSLSLELDYLFFTPKMTGRSNIENLMSWKLSFYDHRGDLCDIQKTGDDLCLMLPRYRMICTTITEGMDFLREFHDAVKYLMKETHPAACDFTQMVQ